MTCEFQSFYFGDDGYVVRCKQCGHYQVAFISTMLTLTEGDFQALCRIVKFKCSEADYSFAENSKSTIIQTPAEAVCILLTRNEIIKFSEILEEADNEAKAQSLISLFNP